MIHSVAAFIREKQLAQPHHRLLAAVSGGIDSVVLCDILLRLRLPFAIAHCHFGLRAEASDADEVFVKKLAKKYGVPFFSKHFHPKALAAEQKVSVQMAARHLRYAWFEQLRQQKGYDAVATAHHRNDSAETLLLNLTKGTGIAGLHGIPVRNGHVIRPLLCLTKAQVRAYAEKHHLAWREDSSNESPKYQRNLIRHEVVPALKKINPAFEDTLQRTIAKMQATEEVLQAYVAEARQKALKQENGAAYLDIAGLQLLRGLPVVLHELLRPYHFSFEAVEEIIASFGGLSGKTFSSPTHLLVKDRHRLVLTPHPAASPDFYSVEEGQDALETPYFRLLLRRLPAEGYVVSPSAEVAALDATRVKFPLRVRKWEQGDWFVPLGMTGKKKISDFLIDRKVPLNLKEQVMVLVSGSDIAWVTGFRPDHRFRITDSTRQVLEIRLERIKKEEDPDH